MKRARLWLFAGILGPLIFWFIFGYHYTGHQECFDCKTWVWFDRRGFGNPNGAHLEFQNSVSESPSIAYKEFFPAGHVHRLVFGQSSNSYLFDGWVCALGRGASNGFTVRLNLDGGFREFIRAKIAAGTLRKEDAAAVASVPHDWQFLESNRAKLSIRESRADYAVAIDLGARLMKEYSDSGGANDRDFRMWPEK